MHDLVNASRGIRFSRLVATHDLATGGTRSFSGIVTVWFPSHRGSPPDRLRAKVAEFSVPMLMARAPIGSPPLLERSTALDRLRRALVEATTLTAGRVVQVTGEEGVGKTALLRAFARDVASDVRVTIATCDPMATAPPLGPLLDIARSTHSQGLLTLLTGSPRPYEVADGVLRALTTQPSLVIIEDLQFADEALLDVLRLVARRIWDMPILLVVSVCDDSIGRADPVRATLGQLASEPDAMRIVLEPLSVRAVGELGWPPEVDVVGIHQLTGGNPFFVAGVLAAGSDRVPATIRDAVLARASRLDPPARSVLDAVAVVAGPTEMWLLEALVPDAARLEDCLQSGLLTSEDSSVRFRHELARQVIEASLPANQRVRLHRLAITAMERPPSGAIEHARIAYHADAASDGAAVLRHAPAAGERASALGAHRRAFAEYQLALPHSSALAAEARADLLEAYGSEALLTGHFVEGLSAANEAQTLRTEVGDPPGLAKALRLTTRFLAVLGRREEACARLEEAIQLLEPLGTTEALARSYASLAAIRGVDDDEEGLRLGARAVALAEEVGDGETLASVLDASGVIECRRGDPSGFRLLERSRELAASNGDEAAVGRALQHEAWMLVRWRDCDMAAKRLDEATSHAIRFGLDASLGWLRALQAECDLVRGRWQAAERNATALLSSPAGKHPQPACTALLVLARLHARRGEDGWARPLEEAARFAAASGHSHLEVATDAARAEIAWLVGTRADLDDAVERLVGLPPQAEPWFAFELECWRHRAGKPPVAPERLPEPYLSQVRGDWRSAAAWWVEHDCPYDAALALQDGDDPDAGREALTRLLELGATRAASVVTGRLRAAGIRGLPRGPRSTTSANPAGLTAREAEVLEQLAAGLSNRAIAQRLFVSVRTADHHVAAVLRKLGASDRAGAVAAAAQLGISLPGETPSPR